MNDDAVVCKSKKAALAQAYWALTNIPMPSGFVLQGLSDVAGSAQFIPWPKLENIAAKRLNTVILGGRRKKGTSKNVVPLSSITSPNH